MRMAKEFETSTVVSHITAPIREGGGITQLVSGAPVKIVKARPGSRGQDTEVTVVNPPPDDWIPTDLSIPERGRETGFAEFYRMYKSAYESDTDTYPVEGMLDESEYKRILEAAEKQTDRFRVSRDPVTKVPNNWAAIDRQPDSDKFFGDNKEPETDAALNRIQFIEQPKEKVDYKTSKAVPIKFLGGK